jgi:hypothetical protein
MEGQNITLSLSAGDRWPHKFPRGELMSITSSARNVSFDPLRVLAWVQQATKAMQAIHGGFKVNDATRVVVRLGPVGRRGNDGQQT